MGIQQQIAIPTECVVPAVFPDDQRAHFATNYPETPHLLRHRLGENALLTLDALAALAGSLPDSSIEYNRGNLPIGVDGKPAPSGLTIEETIRHIATSDSWAVLKNIEQVPEYEALLLSLLGELRPAIEARTGAMLRPQGFVFISSPNAVTPYHFDPEHNILLQLVGSKVMTQFPAGDPRFAPDTVHESYHSGGPRELRWEDELMQGASAFPLHPGEAVFVPVMAPHFVRVGPDSSISLSITWRSDWSFAEADARGFNRILRKAGFSPAAPGRWPATNKPKAYALRALRKLGLAG
ncbi:MAG: transcriptional regulator [Sphingomonadaceae bacterium]